MTSKWTYDVFLSFRGEDTRNTFTGHLYSALLNAGINTFIDDEALPRGEEISPTLLRAIEGSRVAVVVLSRRYADSAWCLDELVKINDCRLTVRQTVLPVFFDIDPSDVRKQSGSFAAAFESHEERFFMDSNRVLRWRNALTKVGKLAGWDLRNEHEAKSIKEIVEEVTLHINSTSLYVALYPIGIDSRGQRISSDLRLGSHNCVRIIGIWGMGGVGKTTLAKAIYNHFNPHFEASSFLSNVRENWDQPCNRVHLQNQLLSDVLRSKEKVKNVDSGIDVIKARFRRKRVLIIVDDVDHMDQLNALARSRDWFGSGSRIIVTTRDEQLLNAIGVDSIHKAKELSESESLELFSCHALQRSCVKGDEFFDLSKEVVAYCGGLPLALEVLGSFLYGRTKEEWKSALKELSKIPNQDIQKKLRISYDALGSDNVKDMFLDIACFFIGKDRNYVQQILDGCGFDSEIGISILLQRCLVTISDLDKIMMHDLLRDTGREIVREKGPKDPGKRCRLWLSNDAINVLNNDEGTREIEGMSIKMDSLSKNSSFSTKAFSEMKRLRLLQLNNVQLNGNYKYLSKELRWLDWRGFPMKFMPTDFDQRNLVAISLKYSNLTQVWKNRQFLEQLKILNASHSHNLRRTPDFSTLPNLEKLILKDCKCLSEVDASIGQLDKLVLINLKDCKALESLPKSFYNLKSLENLVLSGCSMFREFGEELGELISLTTLLADNTGITKVPFTLLRLRNLKHLSVCGLKALLSNTLTASMFWSWLTSWFMPRLHKQEPRSLKGLSSLTELAFSWCNNLHTLPSNLIDLTHLIHLEVLGCSNLRSVPSLPLELKSLYANDCISLTELPDMSSNMLLFAISLKNCKKLVNITGLKSYVCLDMTGCNSITSNNRKRLLQVRKHQLLHCNISGNDISDSFPSATKGNCIYFIVPGHSNCYLEGLLVYVYYLRNMDPTEFETDNKLTTLVKNYTKHISWRHDMEVGVHKRNGGIVCVGYLHNRAKFGAGDVAKIKIDFDSDRVVKNVQMFWCGTMTSGSEEDETYKSANSEDEETNESPYSEDEVSNEISSSEDEETNESASSEDEVSNESASNDEMRKLLRKLARTRLKQYQLKNKHTHRARLRINEIFSELKPNN